MRVRRLLTAVVALGLVAPAAAVVSTAGTSASAAVATSIVPAYTDRPAVYAYSSPAEFGDDLTAYADVVGADGKSVYGGTITVQRQIAGQSSWSTVATDEAPSLYASGLKAEGNALYRITFSGYGDYSPSTLDVAVQVARKVDVQTFSGRRAGLKGKVKPAGAVKIKIERKFGKKYKTMRTVKSNKKGKFIAFLPAPRSGKIHYRITFAGNAQFQKYVWLGYTY